MDGLRCWCGLCGLLLFLSSGCHLSSRNSHSLTRPEVRQIVTAPAEQTIAPRQSSGSPILDKLVDAAIERTNHKVQYDPAYFVLDYPGGDVPPDKGVCTDEIIRSYRALDIDLQKEVHEDMKRNFHLYPKKWGLTKTDPNIDHRRVPNLMIFFERQGEMLPITTDAQDYKPGDIVTWNLNESATHIGIVVGVPAAADSRRLMIVHNIGQGPKMEDVLFNWEITGHYRYYGPSQRRQQ